MKIPRLTTGAIRFLMLPIMTICIGASVRFSAFWHIYIGIVQTWSWGLSGAFILMANILFSLAMGRRLETYRFITPRREFEGTAKEYRDYKAKEKMHFTGGEKVALFVFTLITIYSMTTSVAAQFNRHLEKQRESGITATSSDAILLKEVMSDLEKAKNPVAVYNEGLLQDYDYTIKNLQEEQRQISQSLRDLGPMPERNNYQDDKTYGTARWYWYDTKNKYDSRSKEIRESLSEYQEKKEKLLLPPPVDQELVKELESRRTKLLNKGAVLEHGDDIFSWLSGIFGITPAMIQFILSLFPSLFIDLLAPIASAIFFYGLGSLGGTPGDRGEGYTEKDMQSAYRKGADRAFKLVRKEFAAV